MSARPNAGLTLPELLITLAIASILGSLAAPWWTKMIASNHRIAATNKVVGLIQYARNEAIKAGQEVVLCPDDGTGACLDGDGLWPYGYTMFINDPPGRPWRVPGSAGQLARGTWPANTQILGNRDGWVFRPLAQRSTNGTFRICDPLDRVPPRAVIVSAMGRPRTADRLASGAPIPCPSP
ncbi:MAG: GspH/FimT family pseudopilin [Gammaproteobacteria bacterium]